MIFVTNTNDFSHVDRYDGIDYVFEPGEAVPMDEAAAQHMLGYGLADKSNTLSRLGWAFRYDEDAKKMMSCQDEGVEKLRKFIFSRAMVVKQDDHADFIHEGAGQASLLDHDD